MGSLLKIFKADYVNKDTIMHANMMNLPYEINFDNDLFRI